MPIVKQQLHNDLIVILLSHRVRRLGLSKANVCSCLGAFQM